MGCRQSTVKDNSQLEPKRNPMGGALHCTSSGGLYEGILTMAPMTSASSDSSSKKKSSAKTDSRATSVSSRSSDSSSVKSSTSAKSTVSVSNEFAMLKLELERRAEAQRKQATPKARPERKKKPLDVASMKKKTLARIAASKAVEDDGVLKYEYAWEVRDETPVPIDSESSATDKEKIADTVEKENMVEPAENPNPPAEGFSLYRAPSLVGKGLANPSNGHHEHHDETATSPTRLERQLSKVLCAEDGAVLVASSVPGIACPCVRLGSSFLYIPDLRPEKSALKTNNAGHGLAPLNIGGTPIQSVEISNSSWTSSHPHTPPTSPPKHHVMFRRASRRQRRHSPACTPHPGLMMESMGSSVDYQAEGDDNDHDDEDQDSKTSPEADTGITWRSSKLDVPPSEDDELCT